MTSSVSAAKNSLRCVSQKKKICVNQSLKEKEVIL